jgi:hypothetical protein
MHAHAPENGCMRMHVRLHGYSDAGMMQRRCRKDAGMMQQ